jgi:uncharacterized protein YidB (DUF937 family)
MGLLESIAGTIEPHPDTTEEQHSKLMQAAVQMFGDHAGISGLLGSAESQGLSHIVQSWIGTGSNQSVAPGQVQGIVGQDRLNGLAHRAGVPPATASAALARILPVLVDRFTPGGKLPQAA